ncbi:MAG TPA: glycosyltransferase family 4 protein [Candidatus Cloacimonas sp.]|nr:glycosyltransferase family 4 protein [Candidatus Cloacimonas sp.]
MNNLERLLGLPFFYTGTLTDKILKWNNSSSLFFLFPHYHTGGAEQIHIDILRIFASHRPYIIITNKSRNKVHYKEMQECGKLIDMSKYLNNANRFIVKYFFLGFLSSLINRHHKSIVMSSNSAFFYRLVCHLNDSYLIDIIHGLFGINHHNWLQATPKIDRRIVVSNSILGRIQDIYRKNGVDSIYDCRLQLIYNSVPLCDLIPEKNYYAPLQIVFIARNAQEKRFYLYRKLAQNVIREHPDIKFYCIGNFVETEPVINLGEIVSRKMLYEIIQNFHILVLCSVSEGFGLVIVEGMTCGLIPLATDVGGVKETFQDRINGMLVKAKDEQKIIDEFTSYIKELNVNRDLLQKMNCSAHEYVKEHFSYDRFAAEYLRIVVEGKNN